MSRRWRPVVVDPVSPVASAAVASVRLRPSPYAVPSRPGESTPGASHQPRLPGAAPAAGRGEDHHRGLLELRTARNSSARSQSTAPRAPTPGPPARWPSTTCRPRRARLQERRGTINATRPGCQMPWTLLAGIGRVESDHGRYGGSVLGSDGVPRPAIIGIPLDGQGPVAAIRDTDHGRWTATRSGTARSARCSSSRRPGGPPAVTATVTAWRTRTTSTTPPWRRGVPVRPPGALHGAAQRAAIFRYNPSTYYVDLVRPSPGATGPAPS